MMIFKENNFILLCKITNESGMRHFKPTKTIFLTKVLFQTDILGFEKNNSEILRTIGEVLISGLRD